MGLTLVKLIRGDHHRRRLRAIHVARLSLDGSKHLGTDKRILFLHSNLVKVGGERVVGRHWGGGGGSSGRGVSGSGSSIAGGDKRGDTLALLGIADIVSVVLKVVLDVGADDAIAVADSGIVVNEADDGAAAHEEGAEGVALHVIGNLIDRLASIGAEDGDRPHLEAGGGGAEHSSLKVFVLNLLF